LIFGLIGNSTSRFFEGANIIEIPRCLKSIYERIIFHFFKNTLDRAEKIRLIVKKINKKDNKPIHITQFNWQ
jgi:hypothetical protein